MEGPSLFLAAKQLAPFIKKTILQVSGNTKIGKERLLNQKVKDIFSWGKHLVFQFDDFALRVHFMLYGSFEAEVNGKKVTGDYPKKKQPIRLELVFSNGTIDMYSCSLRYIESGSAKEMYDFSVDIMSAEWDPKKALKRVQDHPEDEISDLLLNQEIFAGVGNIIRNEVMFLVGRSPTTKVKDLSVSKLKEIVKTAQEFSQQFYKWRKRFVLKKHYQVYRRSVCPQCKGKINRKRTGVRKRISFFCTKCQK